MKKEYKEKENEGEINCEHNWYQQKIRIVDNQLRFPEIKIALCIWIKRMESYNLDYKNFMRIIWFFLNNGYKREKYEKDKEGIKKNKNKIMIKY